MKQATDMPLDSLRVGDSTPTQFFTFDGQSVLFRPGETIGAALLASGHLELRIAEYGGTRGLLCGIGVCWECRCVINGRPNSRACMVLAQPGMVVNIQKGLS